MSTVQFRNLTQGNASEGNGLPATDPFWNFSVDYYGVYNNSNLTWVTGIYGWDTNNDTVVGMGQKVFMDAVYVYTDKNVTINMTPGNGHIFANWTNFSWGHTEDIE